MLRCAESGISPSYTVYKNYANELVTNDNTFIFGSYFDGIKDSIINDVQGMSDYLKAVNNAEINDYILINNDVRVVKFNNGVYTVVNFSEKEIETDYGTVQAKSYIYGREAK